MSKKLRALGKMAKGAQQVVSGAATAVGKGIIGGYCRRHDLMGMAARYGAVKARQGQKTFKEGVADWKRASDSC